MRPRELVLSGFRSYAAETTFSWDGRDLVGIVGPIGSGKSSILDAISFALYNKTPRVEQKTTSLINQRRDAAQVALTFDVDGTTYKAVRSLRRKGAPAHALYRVEADGDVELADRAREMGEQVEAMLGLDFDAFRRSVLLAQNQFAGFLEATVTERNQVLKGVFGFDRLDAMRAVAKERLDALGTKLAVLVDRRASAESDRADLEVRRAELVAAEERTTALEGLRAPFEETKGLIAAAEERRRLAAGQVERLDGLVARIPSQPNVEALFAAASEMASKVATAEEAHAAAAEARRSATAALEQRLEPLGGRDGLAAAGDLVAAWRSARDRADAASVAADEAASRVAAAQEHVATLEQQVEAATKAAEEAAARDESAAATAEEAQVRVTEAQQAHRAHAVRADLEVGSPCPVCEQVVTTLPVGAPPEPLTAAQEAAAAARAARDEAAEAARAASDALTRLRAERDGARGALGDAAAATERQAERAAVASDEVERAAATVAEVLGPGDPAALLEELRGEVAEAQRGADAAAVTDQETRAALESVRSESREAESSLASLRTDLATLAGMLEVDVEIREDAGSLREALTVLRTDWIERRAAAEEARVKAGEEAEAARIALTDLLEAAGLGAGDDLADVIAAAQAERTAKEAEVNLLERRLADLERLAADEAELVVASERLRTIHGDLAPSRFLEFVLDERRRVLGDLASEHFEMLSAGRYRFDDSGDFQVVDLTAADSIRAPSSLSGGETFLASLALALALAEIVAREGGRLDAFFLDEGFGSLDPEHLDLAMGGVERLVTARPDRLVVVVSHVPALTERIEDLVVLDRDPVTGDTRVVSGAAAS